MEKLIIYGYLLIITAIYFYKLSKKFDTYISLSQSWYDIEIRIYFMAFMVSTVVCLPYITGNYIVLIASILLGNVAISPEYKFEDDRSKKLNKKELRRHLIGAVGGIVIGMIWPIIEYQIWWPMVTTALLCLFVSFYNGTKEERAKWCEIIALFIINIVILIKIIIPLIQIKL